jgi:hypothetical protein
MALLNSAERHTAEAIVGIGYCNPFLPQRVELERQALADDYVEGPPVKQRRAGLSWAENFPNSATLRDRAKTLLTTMRQRLVDGESASKTDLVLYEDVGLVMLYLQYAGNLGHGMFGELREHKSTVAFWNEFRNEFLHFFECPGPTLPSAYAPAHVFACLYQIERAFSYIFDYIVGGSMPAAKLRASVWQSIFTHDMRRYGRALYRCMGDIPTLILGPSGTGKELVARAIGLSRYIPFDPKSELFLADYKGSFQAVNVAASAPTLVESDLFGHKKGAFTGAVADRPGWFEACDPLGTVFLDEIGELDLAVQVKLLRVLQERKYQRLGETQDREFLGKIIAGTNRNLADEMREGRFREDLYYRLCADIVRTPSMLEQLADFPEDLPNLIQFIALRVLGEDASEKDALTNEVVDWIDEHLGRDYAWPGNFRELEQCVRNVMIRKEYHPATCVPEDPATVLAVAIRAGELTSDELLTRYYKLVFRRTGSYKAAARQLQVDWRTVKDRIC